MRCTLACVLLATTVMCGCLSTARVKRDPVPVPDKEKIGANVSGIPFYVKSAKCKQETTWLQPFYTLTLKKTSIFKFEDPAKHANEKPPEPIVRYTVTKVLSLSQYKDDVAKLKAILNSSTEPDPLMVDQLWKPIAVLPDYQPLTGSEDTLVASAEAYQMSNTSAPEAVVDYSRVYYYNAPRPWVGTSQLDLKLAGDGTLTEASAQVQGQTLSTILSALPISTLLTKAAGAGAAAAAAPTHTPGMVETIHYDLTIVEDGYLHTHYKYVDFALPCPIQPGGVTSNYALTIQGSGQAGNKKDDSNTVKVNGSIVLPQPAANK